VTTYMLTLEGDTVVCQIQNPADIEKLRAHGVTVTACDDQEAMAPVLATMHPQARARTANKTGSDLERGGSERSRSTSHARPRLPRRRPPWRR